MNGYLARPIYRQGQAYPAPPHGIQQAGYGAAPYLTAPTNTQMHGTGSSFMQGNPNQFHYQPSQRSQPLGPVPVDYCQLYGHQMEQFLMNQRVNIQQQLEQRMMIQRKIDQHKKDQLEIASVRSKLGNTACAVENFPFKFLASTEKPPMYGVVKICNLPYAVTKHEIQQLLGRHAGTLGAELGGGIHIIMERSTAKTMDAFVEFRTEKDAEAVARRLSFTESGRYPRLGTRHVDILVSSQDELLHELFPRAKCVEWRDGVPHLLPNTDPYSAGFQGFLTSEEIRGLVSHALNPARSPFTERCRQRTYESLVSTLWKFPWFATTMYTVANRDELYQATIQQILELSDRIKQRKVIGLNESLLMDLLRAGLRCPSFNERQKFCLLAAAELPSFSPIIHLKHFEFWPFDCLAKGTSSTEYQVMYYAQLIRRGLGICDKDDLSIPNNWRNRVDLAKESPWGHLWIEWHLHDKEMTFEAAANLELQLASEILQLAVGLESERGIQDQTTVTGLILPIKPEQKQNLIKHNPGPLPDHWVEDIAKREAINCESPSRQSSDDDSLSLSVGNMRLRSGTSSTFSGGVSHIGSTNGSIATNKGEDKAVPQWIPSIKEENNHTRHQHSQSLSAIAAAAVPYATNHSLRTRRGSSISIPSTIHIAGRLSHGQDHHLSSITVDDVPLAAAVFSPKTDTTTESSINVNTLMSRHGIWSTPPSGLASWTVPGRSSANTGEPDSLSRSGRGSRHTPNPSLTSQQGGLTVVSEDEEDIFNKRTSNNT